MTFEGNLVQGGNADSGKNAAGAAYGGAIHHDQKITFDGPGTYEFTGNQAIGGNATGTGSLTNSSGFGGAIQGLGTMNILRGTFIFTDNIAQGGNASISGRGGGIASNEALSLSGGASYRFEGNRAVGGSSDGQTGSNSTLSGFGAAIFLNATGENRTFQLTSEDGNDVTFRGNTQQSGPNAIYFGNDSTNQ